MARFFGLIRILREGTWVSRERARRVFALLAVAYAAAWVFMLGGSGTADPLGRAIGTDFGFLYGASVAIRGGHAASLYDLRTLGSMVAPYTHGSAYAWLYPPLAMLFIQPLSALPYLWSLAAWLALGLAAWLTAASAILQDRLALAGALVFPAVFMASAHGQSTLLLGAAAAGFFHLLPSRPATAGALLSVFAMKPHLGVLFPLALIAGREWRALAGAAITLSAAVLFTTFQFGAGVWSAFFEGMGTTRELIAAGGVPAFKYVSVFGAVELLGGGRTLAGALQLACATCAAAAVWLAWRRSAPLEVRAAALMGAAFLTTPYAFDYDLTLLGIAVAFLFRAGERSGWLPWERTWLALAWASPFFARALAASTHLQIVPVVSAGLLAVALLRRRVPA